MNWHTMKLKRSDGVLVSAKTYDEVFKFSQYKQAWDFASELLTKDPKETYNCKVKRVCRARNDAFYLAGN
jgi:hypothetical protein